MPHTGEPGRTYRPHRRGKFWTILVLALIVLSAGAWFATRERSLLDPAVRVIGFTNFAWINNQEMVVFDHDGAGNLRAQRIHLQTHAHTYIDAFNSSSAEIHWSNCANAVVAPDGQALFVYVADEKGQASIRTNTDGSEALVLRGSEFPVVLPDGRRWLSLGWPDGGSFNMHGNEPQTLWLGSVDSGIRRVGPLPIAPTVKTLLGVTPDYRLVATDQPRGVDEPMLTLFQRGIYPNTLPERKAILSPPSGWLFRSAALNRNGDQVACLLTTVRRSPLVEMVSHLLPGLIKTRASRVFLVRTYRLDGSHSRDVGFLDTRSPDGEITQLQWTPDGKRLSFYYQNAITIVPASSQ